MTGTRRRLGALAGLSALWLALAGLAPASAYEPHINYMLDCMGCHLARGQGVPGKVPDMRRSLAILAATPAGRRYLVQVPGADQAPLSDAQLAQLLNWMIRRLSAVAVPKSVRPFTADEVASYRGTPLIEVAAVRRRLLAGSRPTAPHGQ